MRLLARTHANPRVREYLPAADGVLVEDALGSDYREFRLLVKAWERLVDTDGTGETAERSHERRNASLVQDFDGGWTPTGEYGLGCSWGDAGDLRPLPPRRNPRRLGESQTRTRRHRQRSADLARTAPQRRADALFALFECVRLRRQGRKSRRSWSTSSSTRPASTNNSPPWPTKPAPNPNPATTAPGAVPTCHWKGCWVPGRDCEADHLTPHSCGGRTTPSEGGPLCGRHNRIKQQGYRTWRDPTGQRHMAPIQTAQSRRHRIR